MKVKSHLSHLNTQSVKKCSEVQKLKTTFRKSWESKRSLINFDKFLTCDLPSSLLQKRVSKEFQMVGILGSGRDDTSALVVVDIVGNNDCWSDSICVLSHWQHAVHAGI